MVLDIGRLDTRLHDDSRIRPMLHRLSRTGPNLAYMPWAFYSARDGDGNGQLVPEYREYRTLLDGLVDIGVIENGGGSYRIPQDPEVHAALKERGFKVYEQNPNSFDAVDFGANITYHVLYQSWRFFQWLMR